MTNLNKALLVVCVFMLLGMIEGGTASVANLYPSDPYERCMAAFEGTSKQAECEAIK